MQLEAEQAAGSRGHEGELDVALEQVRDLARAEGRAVVAVPRGEQGADRARHVPAAHEHVEVGDRAGRGAAVQALRQAHALQRDRVDADRPERRERRGELPGGDRIARGVALLRHDQRGARAVGDAAEAAAREAPVDEGQHAVGRRLLQHAAPPQRPGERLLEAAETVGAELRLHEQRHERVLRGHRRGARRPGRAHPAPRSGGPRIAPRRRIRPASASKRGSTGTVQTGIAEAIAR